ncbi:MAG: 50S ribosomal protein L13 [Planctomycetota bacterium]
MPSTKSYNAQNDSIERSWWIVDGEDQIVGRIASDIAMVLMGKHRPNYTPHVDTGDFVILTNCGKVKFTGNKLSQKTYTWYTGYTGLRTETAGTRLERKPEKVMRDAVRRMLPKNKLGRQMLAKLKIYEGAEHPHQAQDPKPLTGGRTLK